MATMTYPYANATPSAVGNGTATAYDYTGSAGSAGTTFPGFQTPPFAPGFGQPGFWQAQALAQTPGFAAGLSPYAAGSPAGIGTLAPQAWYDIVSKIVSTAVPIVLSTLQSQPQFGQMQPQSYFQPPFGQMTPGYLQPQGFGPGYSPLAASMGPGMLAPQDWRHTVNTVTQVVSSVLPSILSLFQSQPHLTQGYLQPQGFGAGLSPYATGTPGGIGTLAPQAWYDIVAKIVGTAVPIVLSTLQSQPQFGQMQPQSYFQPQGFGLGFAAPRL